MLPSVSVPIETEQKLAEAAAPDPEVEPHGLRSIAYGLLHWPPRPDHPLVEKNDRKFAHSLRVVLPRITAPAARRLAAAGASCAAGAPTRPSDPAAVCILSPVPILSLSKMRTPFNAPRTRPPRRPSSRPIAILFSSRFTPSTALTIPPFYSHISTR